MTVKSVGPSAVAVVALVLAWGGVIGLGTGVLAQSSSRGAAGGSGAAGGERTQQVQTQSGGQSTFEAKFWNWLQQVQYKNWAPIPGQSADAFDGQMPHGAKVKVYVNRVAAGNPKQLPNGSILVKENYGPDGSTLMAITAMFRSEGYDPQHGDWYWVKYEPNGMVSQMNGMAVAGRVGMCAECHSSAEGNDFAFANDSQ